MKTRGRKTSRDTQAQLFLSNYSIFQSLPEFQLPSAGRDLFFLSPVTNVITLLLPRPEDDFVAELRMLIHRSKRSVLGPFLELDSLTPGVDLAPGCHNTRVDGA